MSRCPVLPFKSVYKLYCTVSKSVIGEGSLSKMVTLTGFNQQRLNRLKVFNNETKSYPKIFCKKLNTTVALRISKHIDQ